MTQEPVRYEKPTARDIGPVAPITGASCFAGNLIFGYIVCEPNGQGAGPQPDEVDLGLIK